MAFIDDLQTGYFAGKWNYNPYYPGAVWTAKITLTGTSDVTGLTFALAAREHEASTTNLATGTVTPDTENSTIVLYLKLDNDATTELCDYPSAVAVLTVTENSSGDVYPVTHDLIYNGGGVV